MRYLLVILSALSLTGCDKAASQGDASPPPVFNPAPIAPASQSDLDALKQEVQRLKQSVDAMNRPAELKLGSKGFDTVRTEYGAITIEWTASDPAGAGSKLTFKIGNPHAATLSDIEIYGHPVGTDGKDVDSNTLPWKLKADAPGGSWSHLSAIVDDVPPSKIAGLRITGVTVGGISLKTP